MRVGIFELQDGATPERVARFRETIDAIHYPWWRIIPLLRRDPDQAVVVKWDALRQGVTGLYYGGNRVEVHLSELERAASSEPFVIAHEVGHLVDHATLTSQDRDDLTALTHRDPPIQLGHFDHDHPDAGHTSERWRSAQSYVSRLNEAYADLFVAAFAPNLWDGTAEVTEGRRRWPRFVHWTSDFEEVRRLTLRESIMAYEDVPEDSTHREAILWAAENGLVAGFEDGTFRPNDPITRGQLVTILKRYDERKGEA